MIKKKMPLYLSKNVYRCLVLRKSNNKKWKIILTKHLVPSSTQRNSSFRIFVCCVALCSLNIYIFFWNNKSLSLVEKHTHIKTAYIKHIYIYTLISNIFHVNTSVNTHTHTHATRLNIFINLDIYKLIRWCILSLQLILLVFIIWTTYCLSAVVCSVLCHNLLALAFLLLFKWAD